MIGATRCGALYISGDSCHYRSATYPYTFFISAYVIPTFRPSVQALIALYFHSFDSLHYSVFNHYFSFVSAILFILRLSPVHPSSFPLTRLLLFTSVTSYPFCISVIPLRSVKETYGRGAECTEDGQDRWIRATEYAGGNGTRKRGEDAGRIT